MLPRGRILLSRSPRPPRSLPFFFRPQSSAVLEPLPTPSSPSAPPPHSSPPPSTQSQLSFPCLDTLEVRTANLRKNPPPKQIDPANPLGLHYGHETLYSPDPMTMDHGGHLPELYIAYETWGTLNSTRSNAILLHTGLSASSHAHSHSKNPSPGWWEHVIGPGKPLDTNKFFVICTNPIGGCFGSSGPSSLAPDSGKAYATRFPVVTIFDMVRAQFKLLDFLGIEKLFASVGNSMGGMQSLAASVIGGSERVGRLVSVSAAARSYPSSIAMRFVQRQVLMADPHWNRGDYYDSVPPHAGMKLAREIATITYRSGPEWDARFMRTRLSPFSPPAFCADYQIERYLDHSGEKWWRGYDANSMLYISKAMDLFDMSASSRRRLKEEVGGDQDGACLPSIPYDVGPHQGEPVPSPEEQRRDLVEGFKALKDIPSLVVGAASDILFPARQQREIVECLREAGNDDVHYVELSEKESQFGHDSFLKIDRVGEEIGRFLSRS